MCHHSFGLNSRGTHAISGHLKLWFWTLETFWCDLVVTHLKAERQMLALMTMMMMMTMMTMMAMMTMRRRRMRRMMIMTYCPNLCRTPCHQVKKTPEWTLAVTLLQHTTRWRLKIRLQDTFNWNPAKLKIVLWERKFRGRRRVSLRSETLPLQFSFPLNLLQSA